LRRLAPWIALLLIPLPLLLYSGEITAPLGSDARFLTHQNRFNQTPSGLAQIWTSDFFEGGGDEGVSLRSGYYRPVTSTVYWALHAVAGTRAAPYNLFQMLMHGINAALVLLVLQALSGSALVAVVGGVLFLVHPVHAFAAVEPAALADVLFPVFYLLALAAFDRALRRAGEGPTGVWIALAALAYAGAVLSKEMGITFPAVAVALVLYRHSRAGSAPGSDEGEAEASGLGRSPCPRRALAWTLPFWGVLVAFLVWRFGILAFPLHDFGYVETHGAAAVVGAGFEGLLIHLSRIVAPTGPTFPELNPGLRNMLGPPWADPRVWVGVALVGVLTVLAVGWRRRPAAAFWSAFLLLTFSPLLSVESIARSIHPDLILTEERWIYLPSVALFAAAGYGARALWRRAEGVGARRLVAGAGLLVIALLAWASVLHAGRFRDPYADLRRLYLFSEDELSRKELAQRYLMYAQWVAAPGGDLEEAEARARRAHEIVSDSPLTALGLARILEQRGKWDAVTSVLEPWHRPSAAALDSLAVTNPRVEEDVYRTAPSVALLLTRAAAESGEGDAALRYLCDARALGAPDGEVAEALRRVPGAEGLTAAAACAPRAPDELP
jgi:hypothetical protein